MFIHIPSSCIDKFYYLHSAQKLSWPFWGVFCVNLRASFLLPQIFHFNFHFYIFVTRSFHVFSILLHSSGYSSWLILRFDMDGFNSSIFIIIFLLRIHPGTRRMHLGTRLFYSRKFIKPFSLIFSEVDPEQVTWKWPTGTLAQKLG